MKAIYVVLESSTDIRLVTSPPKTCSLDPLPTNILLQYVDMLLPYICAMCNATLREDCLPASPKVAFVTPIVKQPGLDPDEPESHRPFILKVIEGIVANQIKVYLAEQSLMPPVQSAYHQGHSTEKALLEVISDITDTADCQKVTFLVLLDMNACRLLTVYKMRFLLHRLEV